MNRDAVATITDRIFNRALQARRLLQRDAMQAIAVPLAELVMLGRRLEPLVAPDALEHAATRLAGQRWGFPRVEVDSRKGYAVWASSYDDESNPLIALEEPATFQLVGDVAGKDVLDAACGTGRYAIRLAEAGARVCGVDVSEEMLAIARQKRDERGLDMDLQVGELTALPYADGSFDVAVCALTFCHLPDLHPAAMELARVLRPGGRLVVSDFHPFCLLIGWRTSVSQRDATYFIENYVHLTQDYLGALWASGFSVTDLREEVVDERLLSMFPPASIERDRSWPGALIIAARRQ